MPREAIPTWFFSLVVVRRGDQFLLVKEAKHGNEWYLPAGRVEPGESLVEAAVRETREEGGIPVEVVGILRLEHTPWPDGARFRALFVARPTDDTPPKDHADEESLEARWVTLAELEHYPLRSQEVRVLFEAVANGAPLYPVTLLTTERG